MPTAKYYLLQSGNLAPRDPSDFHLARPDGPADVFTTFLVRPLRRSGSSAVRWGVLGLDLHLARLHDGAAQVCPCGHSLDVLLEAEPFRHSLAAAVRDYLGDAGTEAADEHGAIRVRTVIRAAGAVELHLERYSPPWQSDAVISLQSVHAERMFPELKTTVLDASSGARAYATGRGAEEALLIGPSEEVREGAWSNLFWFDQHGRLCTPQAAVLPGVTAKLVGRIRRTHLVPIRLSELISTAAEIFITQSTTGITAVGMVDGRSIAQVIGAQTRAVQDEYQRMLDEESEVVL